MRRIFCQHPGGFQQSAIAQDAPKQAIVEECDDVLKTSGNIVDEVHAEIAKLRLIVESFGDLQAHMIVLQETNAKQRLAMAAMQKECESTKIALTTAEKKHSDNTEALTNRHQKTTVELKTLTAEKVQIAEQLAAANIANDEQIKAMGVLKAAKAAAAAQLATALQQVKIHAAKAKETEKLTLQVQTLKSLSTKATEDHTKVIASLKTQLAEKEKQFAQLTMKLKTTATQSTALQAAVETAEVQAKKAKTETCDFVKTLADAKSELAILNEKLEKLANIELAGESSTKSEAPKKE